MIVMKFGGSSVANRSQIEKVAAIVQSRRDRRPVVVCSAHKGITDGLIDAAQTAAAGRALSQRIIDRQREIAHELGCSDDLLEPMFREIADLLRGLALVRELSPRSLDYVSSFGERMSVRCIADYMTRHGLPARAYDAWDLGFVTDAKFGRARPLADFAARTQAAFTERVPDDVVPIVTGFVGKTTDGEITTLGRNGSDLTASLLASALAADEVEIWSDTDGVMTADPSIVANARSIATMRFDEAAELAYFGSRVLHPATLLPAIESDIAVRVLNTNRPEHPGTVITASPPPKAAAVTSIAYKEGQAVLTVTDMRMFEQVGFLARLFAILARHEVVVDMVATSEVSVSVTSHDLPQLQNAMPELETLGRVELKPNKSILAVVGRHIHGTPGLGSRVLRAVADADVNIEMHSFGMGSNNISLVVDDTHIAAAVAALHREMCEQP